MKLLYPAIVVLSLAVSGFSATDPLVPQRAPRGKVQALQATSDKAGVHPATANITGPVTITCVNAASETPNSRPAPSCHVVAPGFKGNLDRGKTINVTGPGAVTLTCNGQGYMRCDARVDIPPPSK
jgi:hypothetical protein